MKLTPLYIISVIFALCLLFMVAIGCAPKVKPDTSTPVTGNAIGRADAYRENASENIKAAIPHTNSTGKVYLAVGDGQLDKQKVELSIAATANRASGLAIQQMGNLIEHQKSIIESDKKRWIGQRLSLYAKWAAGIAIAGWLLMGVLSAYLPAGGVGSTIMRLLPFMNPFAWFRDKVIRA